MDSFVDVLGHDHQRCDRLFAQVEESVAHGDLAHAGEEFSEFERAMERHFTFEEETLFPALEQASGQRAGPTQVMRMEHSQMRSLFQEMKQEIAGGNKDRYLGLSETLLILMQQHNMKEEQILYRMADQMLAADVTRLLERLPPG